MSTPSVRIMPLAGLGISVRILNPVAPDPAHAAGVSAAWEALRAANPRYHDGPILIVTNTDPLEARRDTYRTLATAPALDPAIRALGVQGLVIGRDQSGREHVLFGRRSSETRIYGGLWENAPSGGMTAPPGRTELTLADFTAALRDEGLEELGLDLQGASITPIALLEDPHAFSTDLVLEVRLHAPINPRALPCPAHDAGRWEYIDAAWVPTDDIGAWMRRDARAISPPTLALFPNEPGTL